MKIACLGWGSLVWRPEGLPVRKPWFSDGPLLPIEFARRSDDDRITLVLVPPKHKYSTVRSMWALMSVRDLETAKAELAKREHINEGNVSKNIGYWSQEAKYGDYAADIGKWAGSIGLEGAVWTALPPKAPDGKTGDFPGAAKIVEFLRNLSQERRKNAEEYIRRAPIQTDTEYRRQFESELGWTPIGR